MSLVDLRSLGAHKLAIIDDGGRIDVLAQFGRARPFSPQESRQFQAFLASNEPRLTAACGGTPIREYIRVWKPSDAQAALDPSFLPTVWPLLLAHPGRAVACGSLRTGPWTASYYGGFSPDGSQFVLVPVQLHEMRYRELLLVHARATTPALGEDLFALAITIEREERRDDPDGGHPSALVAAAHIQALDVAYWLELAGPTPMEQDALDARRK